MTLVPRPPESGDDLPIRSDPPIVCRCGSFLADCDHPMPSDPHALTRTEYGSSVALVCACGRWECIVTGPSSAAWAGRDYRRHVDEETAADA